MLQWDLGDVACPDLIGLRNRHIPEKIPVNLVARVRATGRSLGTRRLEAHQSQEPLDPVAIDPEALPDLSGAEERQLDVQAVDLRISARLSADYPSGSS
jgi:hypothetical protein